jgi:hypothetical protein
VEKEQAGLPAEEMAAEPVLQVFASRSTPARPLPLPGSASQRGEPGLRQTADPANFQIDRK